MKTKDVFDVAYKMGRLADDAKDLVMLLTRVHAPASLIERFLRLSEYAGNVASFIRVNEEFPPEQAPPADNVRKLTPGTPFLVKPR